VVAVPAVVRRTIHSPLRPHARSPTLRTHRKTATARRLETHVSEATADRAMITQQNSVLETRLTERFVFVYFGSAQFDDRMRRKREVSQP
jgi:hypothetical protein